MTLTDKVYAVLRSTGSGGALYPMQAAGIYPRTGEGSLTEFEMDCRDWGFVFGVAFGIARGEEPFESDHSVCERALDSAREAFGRLTSAPIFTEDAFEKDRATREAASATPQLSAAFS